MKHFNLRKCVTALAFCICLLTGSELATAKDSYWQTEPLEKQQQDLLVIDTKYRVDLAKEIESDVIEAIVKPATQTAPKIVVKLAQSKQSISIKNAQTKRSIPAKSIEVRRSISAKSTKIKQIIPSKRTETQQSIPSNSLKKAGVTKQVPVSTKEYTLKIASGSNIKYSRLIPVKATAYTAAAEENGIWGPYDYYGNPLKLGTIAVDPDVIPMGSTVYVSGYSFEGLPAKGMIAKATDQGGSIQGKRVDIFIPTSKADATKFGMQDVKVYIIK